MTSYNERDLSHSGGRLTPQDHVCLLPSSADIRWRGMDREGGSDRLEKRRRGPILFLRRHHKRAWGADKAEDLDAVSSIVAYLEICPGSYLAVIQLVLSPHCIINLIYGAQRSSVVRVHLLRVPCAKW